jgi:hypothetical protein
VAAGYRAGIIDEAWRIALIGSAGVWSPGFQGENADVVVILPLAALAYFGLDAAGLFVNRDLAACLVQSEQTILLRQMALTGKAKDTIDYCLGEMTWFAPRQVTREDWCRGLYVNANRPAQACMFRKGYTFMDLDRGYSRCDWSEFRKPECFRTQSLALVDTVLAEIKSEQQPPKFEKPQTSSSRVPDKFGEGQSNSGAALRAQIQRCWTPPSGTNLIVVAQFSLSRDGALVGDPIIISQSGHETFPAAAESARGAIRKCQPFKLPDADYETWRDVEITFDPNDAARPWRHRRAPVHKVCSTSMLLCRLTSRILNTEHGSRWAALEARLLGPYNSRSPSSIGGHGITYRSG